ncbi:MAG: DUF434 domain-containing protein [Thermodesulfobacteriota bacterium]
MKTILETKILNKAARDFRYLLNRGYPRKLTLELVGNRYALTSEERNLLHRGIFSDPEAKARKKKKISLNKIRNKDLAIDGYNVIITIEAALSGRPLVLGDDGFIRDISSLSSRFKKTELTEKAIQLILQSLKKEKPCYTLLLFDAPISKSGLMAKEIRELLKKENIYGDAQVHPYPERVLNEWLGVVATSDTAIIHLVKEVVDLAGDILKKGGYLKSLIKFKSSLSFSHKRCDIHPTVS